MEHLSEALVDEPSSKKARRLLRDVANAIKARDAARAPDARARAAALVTRADASYKVGDVKIALVLYGCLLDSMLGEDVASARLIDGETIIIHARPFDAAEASKLHHFRAGCFSKLRRYADAEEESRRALELREAVPDADPLPGRPRCGLGPDGPVPVDSKCQERDRCCTTCP
jgi:hypothetical protein